MASKTEFIGGVILILLGALLIIKALIFKNIFLANTEGV